MLIYLIIFSIAILFTYLAERNQKSKLTFIILSLVPILSLTLLAGFRASGIGTDTLIYVNDTWRDVNHFNSFTQFYKAYKNDYFDDIEFVYLLINWVASFFGKDLFNIYFATSLCTILPIYISAYQHRKQAPMWFVMLSFCFIYYNQTYNLVRQSISLALCVCSLKYLEEKKWIKFFFFLILILNAHNTGVFFILFVMLYYIWFYMRNLFFRKTLLITITSIFPLLLIFIDLFILFAVGLNLLPAKYLMYLGNDEKVITTAVVLINMMVLFILSYIKAKIKDKPYIKDINFTIFTKFWGIILSLASYFSVWAFRISYYFMYPVDCILIPSAVFSIKKKNPGLYKIVLLTLTILYIVIWFWTNIYKGVNETYPYKSNILKF